MMVAAMATGEWRQDQTRSLSQAVFNLANILVPLGARQLGAQTWIDQEVQQVYQQVDHNKYQGNQTEVGRHHGDVGKLHGLDKQQTHARPLENGFRHDGKGDDAAQLQTRDGDNRHHGVFQGVAKVDSALRQATGTSKFDVVGAQDFQHLGAHQTQDQRELEQTERDGGQDQMLDTVPAKQAGTPPAKLQDFSPGITGQPAQLHGEDQDQQDTDQEGGQGYSQQGKGQNALRHEAIALQGGVHP